jgi:signal transduction histidine kinase
MKRYFVNPEIKISSGILLALMIVFLIFQIEILKIHNDRLKENYVKSIGAITARVIDKNPELEKEIMPLVTKGITEEEAAKGKAIVAQYGLSTALENELFPYVNSTIKRNNYSMTFIFIVMTIVLFIFNYFQYGVFYERLRRLTIGAKKVVEGDYHLTINENKEGDFSKLAFSFNSMREIIRNNISELKHEKQFLVDLLSDISHQLKTPLSSMIIYNDIMINKDLTKEQSQKFLLDNQSQLSRMKGLIQSMLKLAKLDAKAIELDKEQQSLNDTIQEVIDTLESKAKEGKIHINFIEKSEVVFDHDSLWLEEALINIVKNGIEHTSQGGIINIELMENPIYRRITIEDTGEGIGEEDLPNIFKRFYKAKTSRKRESVGIGLALAKSIIEFHNGIIECQSKVSEGTKFTITFVKY